MATESRLIALVGPTASGKTSLALKVAERWNGEIICADSRTIYKGMDIGTAKPSPKEQARVPHWGLDLVEPDQRFTAADFQTYAKAAITDIQSRSKLPLLVGGTGLYIDAVMYDFDFGGKSSLRQRAGLEEMSIEELQSYCVDHNITLPENDKNKRHLIRAIERKGISDIGKSKLQRNHYIVGIATNKDTLRTRILERTEHLFENDVVGEATLLGKKYGWNHESMTGNIYPLIKSHLEGEVTIAEAKEKFTTLDWQLAKRQMTWLRRNPDIMWTTLTEAEDYINSLLATE